MYTERFSEAWELIGKINAASYSSEQNFAARIDIGGYTRFICMVFGATGSGNAIDLDIEEATLITGGTLQTLDSGNKDMTLADAEYIRFSEFRSEEFSTNDGFNFLNVEMTPAGARVCGVLVFGLAKSKAPANTLVDGITD